MKKETKQPDIPIGDISSKNKAMAEIQSDINRHEQNIKSQKKLMDWTFGFIIAILIICFLGFITFLLDAWRFHTESYNKFTEILKIQEEINNSKK